MSLLSQLRDVPARLRTVPASPPTTSTSRRWRSIAAHAAAGVTAVAVAMRRAVGQMGVRRTAQTLLRLNQVDGFDCQGCAWPDPDPGHRHAAEFCENGAKAVAEEATRQQLGPRVLRHPLGRATWPSAPSSGWASRAASPSRWCCARARPTTSRSPGTTRSPPCRPPAPPRRPRPGGRSTPRARPPTRPRSSTSSSCGPSAPTTCPTAPTCATSRPGSALAETIGIGKGSVTLEDIHQRRADRGRRARTPAPTTRGCSPRWRRPRRTARRSSRSTRCEEAGLVRFKNPQNAQGRRRSRHRAGRPAPADPAQRRPGALPGDRRAAARVGRARPRLPRRVHHRLRGVRRPRRATSTGPRSRPSTGLTRDQITEAAADVRATPPATITCWAMGITQHRNAVATIKEIVNVALLQGNIGKPGAGLCPVRGHSNVQGDRTMGIWERVPDHFLDALRDEFGFEPPREHGYDTVDAIQALRDGKARVFFGMGGNFVAAAPDTEVTEAAMRNAALTVHVSTKLNRSHVVHGGEALILPALGRSEKDLTGGREQRVTVEDSMSAVHASQGPLEPAVGAPALRGRHRLLAGAGHARRGLAGPVGGVPRPTTARSGAGSRASSPAARRTTRRSTSPAASCCRTRRATTATFETETGKAVLTVTPARGARRAARAGCCCRRCAPTTSSTPRSTASTTATAASRAGAAWCSSTPTTSRDLGFADGDLVDLVSEWQRRRRAGGAGVPDRVLRPAARLRGGLLPGDQPARAARLDGRGQQPAGLQVGRGAPRPPGQARRRQRTPRVAPTPGHRLASAPTSRTTCPEADDDQPRARPRRGGPGARRHRRGVEVLTAAGGPARRAAGDDRTPHAAAARSAR